MTPQDVGRIIKEARELKRWSQESLAREAGGVSGDGASAGAAA